MEQIFVFIIYLLLLLALVQIEKRLDSQHKEKVQTTKCRNRLTVQTVLVNHINSHYI